jgi:hypothetical protein
MRAADRLDARFGKAEMLDLAFANQILDRARDVLDRDVRIDAMKLMPMQPKPRAETSRPFLPNTRFCMASSSYGRNSVLIARRSSIAR